MELILKRTEFNLEFTLGQLYIDGAFFCYTVEDTVRDSKVFGKTAIPYGKYKVSLTMSNRFKKVLPLLEKVPNFEGVRIHSGNTALDTEGCLIVGMEKTSNGVSMSKIAMAKLMSKLENQTDINITITK